MSFLKKQNREKFFCIDYKLTLLKYVSDPESVDIIFSFLQGPLLIKSRTTLHRNIELPNINKKIFHNLTDKITSLIGINLLKCDRNYSYTKYQIDLLYHYCALTDITIQDSESIYTYDEFTICAPDSSYIIKKIDTKYFEYDCVMGLDLLLLIMRNLYDISYKKVSKQRSEELQSRGDYVQL